MGIKDATIHMNMDILPSEDPFAISKFTDPDKRRNEILRRILMGELTERQRRCILLYFGSEMTLEEIGKTLGINKSTVSKHIKLGKEKLKKILEYSGEKGSLHFFAE